MTQQTRPEHWVSLAGGNALGAFHLGAIEALADAGVPVTRVSGASIGAVTAGLWFGGAAETALWRLRTFWERARENAPFGIVRGSRQLAASRAMLSGRPGLFHPTLPGIWGANPLAPDDDHLHSTAPMRRTLEELIDFDALNDGPGRVVVNALEQQTAEDVVFDSAHTRLTVDHLLASSALPLLFPPVEIDGRLLVDPGLSVNLPVDALFQDRPVTDTVCWAIDLWPPLADRVTSLGTVARRQQDLMFAAQSRHTLQRVAESSTALRDAGVSVAVHHLGYDGGDWETAGKAFDYSPAAIERRVRAGKEAMQQALADSATPKGAGLHITRHAFQS